MQQVLPPADVLILTALSIELQAILKVNEGSVESNWTEFQGPAGYTLQYKTFQGDHGKLRIAASCVHRKNVPATQAAAQTLASVIRPRCLAMSGVCAGRPEKAFKGQVVVADRVYNYNKGSRKVVAGHENVSYDIETYSLREDWRRLASKDSAVVIGPMASGDFVQRDPALWEDLATIMPGVVAYDMEAVAIGIAANELRSNDYAPDILIMKGVMDHADLNKDDSFKQVAAMASASAMIHFLRIAMLPSVQKDSSADDSQNKSSIKYTTSSIRAATKSQPRRSNKHIAAALTIGAITIISSDTSVKKITSVVEHPEHQKIHVKVVNLPPGSPVDITMGNNCKTTGVGPNVDVDLQIDPACHRESADLKIMTRGLTVAESNQDVMNAGTRIVEIDWATRTISGTVVLPDGTFVAAASVWFADPSCNAGQAGRTDQEGHFQIVPTKECLEQHKNLSTHPFALIASTGKATNLTRATSYTGTKILLASLYRVIYFQAEAAGWWRVVFNPSPPPALAYSIDDNTDVAIPDENHPGSLIIGGKRNSIRIGDELAITPTTRELAARALDSAAPVPDIIRKYLDVSSQATRSHPAGPLSLANCIGRTREMRQNIFSKQGNACSTVRGRRSLLSQCLKAFPEDTKLAEESTFDYTLEQLGCSPHE